MRKKYWTISSWYEFDVVCSNFHDVLWTDEYHEVQKYLFRCLGQIRKISVNNEISNWFFLYEGKTIRIRIKTESPSIALKEIQHLFPEVKRLFPYKEETWKFKSVEAIEFFAKLMNVVSEMVLSHLEDEVDYDIYRQYERISHCLHINMFGRNNELSVLTKRIAERMGDLKGTKSKLSAKTEFDKLK